MQSNKLRCPLVITIRSISVLASNQYKYIISSHTSWWSYQFDAILCNSDIRFDRYDAMVACLIQLITDKQN